MGGGGKYNLSVLSGFTGHAWCEPAVTCSLTAAENRNSFKII